MTSRRQRPGAPTTRSTRRAVQVRRARRQERAITWRRVHARARRRSGLVTSAELRAAGVPGSTARYRVAIGQWSRPQRGVYDIGAGGLADDPLRRIRAALAASAPRLLVTGRAAAWLLGILSAPPGVIDLLAEHRRRLAARPGTRLRRTTRAALAGGTTVLGIPVAGPAWVLADLADELDDDTLARAIATACRLRRTTLPALRRLLEERGRFPGCRRLRRVLDDLEGGLDHSRDEQLLRRACQAIGLTPLPGKVTIYLDGVPVGETDLAFDPGRLDVQVDGPHHYLADQAAADRVRDRKVARAGWVVLRFGGAEVRADAGAVARQIAEHLRPGS